MSEKNALQKLFDESNIGLEKTNEGLVVKSAKKLKHHLQSRISGDSAKKSFIDGVKREIADERVFELFLAPLHEKGTLQGPGQRSFFNYMMDSPLFDEIFKLLMQKFEHYSSAVASYVATASFGQQLGGSSSSSASSSSKSGKNASKLVSLIIEQFKMCNFGNMSSAANFSLKTDQSNQNSDNSFINMSRIREEFQKLIDGSGLTTLFELDKSTRKEILSKLSVIFQDEKECAELLSFFKKFLSSGAVDSEIVVSILDCITGLNIFFSEREAQDMSDIIDTILDQYLQSFSAFKIPVVLRFLLQAANEENASRIVKSIREHIDPLSQTIAVVSELELGMEQEQKPENEHEQAESEDFAKNSQDFFSESKKKTNSRQNQAKAARVDPEQEKNQIVALIIETLNSNFHMQSCLVKAFLDIFNSPQNDQSTQSLSINAIDIWLFILLFNNPQTKEMAEKGWKKVIAEEYLTPTQFESLFANYFPILDRFFGSLVEMAKICLSATPSAAAGTFGKSAVTQVAAPAGSTEPALSSSSSSNSHFRLNAMGKQMFFQTFGMFLDNNQRNSIVSAIIELICSGSTSLSVENALETLLSICEAHTEQFATVFSSRLNTLLDHLDTLTVNQIRKVYSIFALLSWRAPNQNHDIQNINRFKENQNNTTRLRDSFMIMIRKQMANPTFKYKRMALIGNALYFVRNCSFSTKKTKKMLEKPLLFPISLENNEENEDGTKNENQNIVNDPDLKYLELAIKSNSEFLSNQAFQDIKEYFLNILSQISHIPSVLCFFLDELSTYVAKKSNIFDARFLKMIMENLRPLLHQFIFTESSLFNSSSEMEIEEENESSSTTKKSEKPKISTLAEKFHYGNILAKNLIIRPTKKPSKNEENAKDKEENEEDKADQLCVSIFPKIIENDQKSYDRLWTIFPIFRLFSICDLKIKSQAQELSNFEQKMSKANKKTTKIAPKINAIESTESTDLFYASSIIYYQKHKSPFMEFSKREKDIICLTLFCFMNWHRELLNRFIPSISLSDVSNPKFSKYLKKEMVIQKVQLKRLCQILTCEKNLRGFLYKFSTFNVPSLNYLLSSSEIFSIGSKIIQTQKSSAATQRKLEKNYFDKKTTNNGVKKEKTSKENDKDEDKKKEKEKKSKEKGKDEEKEKKSKEKGKDEGKEKKSKEKGEEKEKKSKEKEEDEEMKEADEDEKQKSKKNDENKEKDPKANEEEDDDNTDSESRVRHQKGMNLIKISIFDQKVAPFLRELDLKTLKILEFAKIIEQQNKISKKPPKPQKLSVTPEIVQYLLKDMKSKVKFMIQKAQPPSAFTSSASSAPSFGNVELEKMDSAKFWKEVVYFVKNVIISYFNQYIEKLTDKSSSSDAETDKIEDLESCLELICDILKEIVDFFNSVGMKDQFSEILKSFDFENQQKEAENPTDNLNKVVNFFEIQSKKLDNESIYKNPKLGGKILEILMKIIQSFGTNRSISEKVGKILGDFAFKQAFFSSNSSDFDEKEVKLFENFLLYYLSHNENQDEAVSNLISNLKNSQNTQKINEKIALVVFKIVLKIVQKKLLNSKLEEVKIPSSKSKKTSKNTENLEEKKQILSKDLDNLLQSNQFFCELLKISLLFYHSSNNKQNGNPKFITPAFSTSKSYFITFVKTKIPKLEKSKKSFEELNEKIKSIILSFSEIMEEFEKLVNLCKKKGGNLTRKLVVVPLIKKLTETFNFKVKAMFDDFSLEQRFVEDEKLEIEAEIEEDGKRKKKKTKKRKRENEEEEEEEEPKKKKRRTKKSKKDDDDDDDEEKPKKKSKKSQKKKKKRTKKDEEDEEEEEENEE